MTMMCHLYNFKNTLLFSIIDIKELQILGINSNVCFELQINNFIKWTDLPKRNQQNGGLSLTQN